MISCITILSVIHVSYRMYTLYIPLCITAGGNAFPQLQRKTSYLVLRAMFADFISLIDVFSDVSSDVFRGGGVQLVIVVRRRHEIIINLCLIFWIIFSDKQNYGL